MKECLIISTYPPRKCGIATFSKDLRDNLIKFMPHVSVAAIKDAFNTHLYPAEVVVELDQETVSDYTECAEWINRNTDLEMVIIQHEYGIYGGSDGEKIIELVSNLNKPYLLVTHTVLTQPSEHQKDVLTRLCKTASGVICMTSRASKVLENVYAVPARNIYVVPDGVPSFSPKNRISLKKEYGLQGRRIITTFGLIGPGKGLEIGLEALARVVPKHPEALYIIAGKTHPNLLRSEGERYRNEVMQMTVDLQLQNHVLFVNHYLDNEELGNYLYMTDIYLSPYPNLDQAVSGTLSFAVGCGRAIISTPYEHAREILAEGRGMIAREPTAEALAELLEIVLGDPGLQRDLESKAAELSLSLSWASAAKLYYDIANKTIG